MVVQLIDPRGVNKYFSVCLSVKNSSQSGHTACTYLPWTRLATVAVLGVVRVVRGLNMERGVADALVREQGEHGEQEAAKAGAGCWKKRETLEGRLERYIRCVDTDSAI